MIDEKLMQYLRNICGMLNICIPDVYVVSEFSIGYNKQTTAGVYFHGLDMIEISDTCNDVPFVLMHELGHHISTHCPGIIDPWASHLYLSGMFVREYSKTTPDECWCDVFAMSAISECECEDMFDIVEIALYQVAYRK